MNIVVTRFVNDQPAHRHVRFEGVRPAKADRIVSDVGAEEYDRLERGRPVFYRDMKVHGVVVLHRKYDTGSVATVFVTKE